MNVQSDREVQIDKQQPSVQNKLSKRLKFNLEENSPHSWEPLAFDLKPLNFS